MNGTNTAAALPSAPPDRETTLRRVNAALDRLEEMEHRVSVVIEGNRQQMDYLVAALKIPQLRAELRACAVALQS